MDTPVPVKVGTRGTLGSLIRKEMEYFRGPERNYVMVDNKACGGGNSWPGLSFLRWKTRKKKSRSGRFLPSFCSVADVADQQQLNRIASFSYRNLKAQAHTEE